MLCIFDFTSVTKLCRVPYNLIEGVYDILRFVLVVDVQDNVMKL